jgi:biotin carboxyl carrier protein
MPQERIESPLPGTIVGVSVGEGSKVNEGDELCLLESMKMENPILAPLSGIVSQIRIEKGQTVQASALLMVIGY